MLVYLFRHGERHSRTGSDPSLTEVGMRQAENLLNMVEERKLPEPHTLWISPRLRTRQTFDPLSKKLGLTAEVIPDLNERIGGSASEFIKQVHRVLRRIETSHQNIFLCSHFDWLEEALNQIQEEESTAISSVHWSPCTYAGFEVQEGLWQFIETGQVPLC